MDESMLKKLPKYPAMRSAMDEGALRPEAFWGVPISDEAICNSWPASIPELVSNEDSPSSGLFCPWSPKPAKNPDRI